MREYYELLADMPGIGIDTDGNLKDSAKAIHSALHDPKYRPLISDRLLSRNTDKFLADLVSDLKLGNRP